MRDRDLFSLMEKSQEHPTCECFWCRREIAWPERVAETTVGRYICEDCIDEEWDDLEFDEKANFLGLEFAPFGD